MVDLIMKGGNVCYTGTAGTGKSFVLKAVVEKLKAQGKRVDIVAPSGIAGKHWKRHIIIPFADCP